MLARPADHERPDDAHRDRIEVEQRQRCEHDVVGPALPRAGDLLRERDDVVVRQHAALRRSGRAGGVDEARQVGRTDRGIGRPARRMRRRAVARQSSPGHGRDRRRRARRSRSRPSDPAAPRRIAIPRRPERRGRPGRRSPSGAESASTMPQELALVRRVDRHLDRTELERGEEGDDLLRPVLEQGGDSVGSAHTQCRERVRERGWRRRPSRAR